MSLFDAILEAAWSATESSARWNTNDARDSMSRRVDQETEKVTVNTAFQDVYLEHNYRITDDLVSTGLDSAISTG